MVVVVMMIMTDGSSDYRGILAQTIDIPRYSEIFGNNNRFLQNIPKYSEIFRDIPKFSENN